MSALERTPDGKVVVTGVSAAVATRLAGLVSTNGKLLAKDVLDDARDARSPLHDYFQWDDTAAAEAYRLSQATALIRRVKVTILDDSNPEPVRVQVRYYTAEKDVLPPAVAAGADEDEGSGSGAYISIERIVGNSAYESNLIESMRRDIQRIKAKYSNTTLLLRVWREEFPNAA